MKPNINRRGRIARALSGMICIGLGIAVWPIAWPEVLLYRWIASVLLVVCGGFQLFEAKKGWCAARACGIKTPM